MPQPCNTVSSGNFGKPGKRSLRVTIGTGNERRKYTFNPNHWRGRPFEINAELLATLLQPGVADTQLYFSQDLCVSIDFGSDGIVLKILFGTCLLSHPEGAPITCSEQHYSLLYGRKYDCQFAPSGHPFNLVATQQAI